jgi:hypothetical protein
LIWKEFRQAFPFCLKVLAIGLIALAGVPLNGPNQNGATGQLIPALLAALVMIAPLLPGVAAMRAERKDGAFRLLANRGVTPDGFFICKQAVWLSLSLLVFGIILVIDRSFLSHVHLPARVPSLWDFAAGAAHETFGSADSDVMVPLVVAAFHVFLLFELGTFLGLLLPGPIVAFFAGAVVWAALALCWMVVASLRIPFWWTVGLFPLIFLAVTWVRTADWLVGRNSLRAAGKATGTFVIPLVGIVAATVVFRITEIPAVAIPQAVLEQGRPQGAQSPFAEALSALSEGPPMQHDELIQSNGWLMATGDQRAWVERNSRALKLALEAAKHESGSLDRTMQYVTLERKWRLAKLLLFSARKLERENELEKALACYIAVARLTGRTETSLDWMKYWAARPKQTTAQVKSAILEFESLQPNGQSLSSQILSDWRSNRRLLHHDIWGHSPADAKSRTVSELWWTRWFFPWELVRLERLQDASFEADLREADEVQSDLKSQGFLTMTADRAARWNRRDAIPWKYWQTTLGEPDRIGFPFVGPERYVDGLATERMGLIALALIDFKREQHKLPVSLRELVPIYFSQLPVDPWTGNDFLYEPKGLFAEIIFKGGRIDPWTPFLVSAGVWDSRLVQTQSGNPSYEVVDHLAPGNASQRHPGPPTFSGPAVQLP